jgi:hypothetical protein
MADNKDRTMPDGEKTRGFRFNIIDLFIVIAIAVIVTGVAFRYNILDRIGIKSNDDTVIISFLIRDIKESSADALVVDDVFYWEANKMEIGRLISKKPSFAEAFIENNEGILVKTYNENSYDVRGEIIATGKFKDKNFMLGGTQFLAPGKTLYVESRNIMVNMLITKITQVEGSAAGNEANVD